MAGIQTEAAASTGAATTDDVADATKSSPQMLRITKELSDKLSKWDVDKDGFLSEDEVLTILGTLGVVKRDAKRQRVYLGVLALLLIVALGAILGLCCLAVYLVKDTRVTEDGVLTSARDGEPVRVAEIVEVTGGNQWTSLGADSLLAAKAIAMYADDGSLIKFDVDAMNMTRTVVTFSSAGGWSATFTAGNTSAILRAPGGAVVGTGSNPSRRRHLLQQDSISSSGGVILRTSSFAVGGFNILIPRGSAIPRPRSK